MESRFSRLRFVMATVAAVLLHTVLPSPAAAQLRGATPRGTTYENYDVRDADDTDADASRAVRSNYRSRQVTAPRAAALVGLTGGAFSARANLQAAVPSLQTESNPFGTGTEIVGTATSNQFLTAPSSAAHETVFRGFLAQYAALYGLTATETAALVKTADYTNPAGNLSWVRLEQRINGLPVFQGEIQAAFTADGALARTTGNLAGALDASSLPTAAVLSPAQAVTAASSNIGHQLNAARLTTLSTEETGRVATLAGGPYVRATRTELVYFPLEPGVATLAYAMVLWDRPRAYSILVDAGDGTLLFRKCITDDQTQAVTYNVYTGASPSAYNPTTALPGQGFQAPGVARVDVTLVADNLTASPLGWITDSAVGGTVTTTGNNCDAGLDVDTSDGIDAGSRPTSTTRTFSFSYSPAPLGTESPKTAASRSGAITNLFFWTNRYHDALYALGFTEPARNFQTTNTFGGINRTGLANDAVSAQVQDTADAGTSANYNNANFSTPSDGSPGIMQMYLFNSPTPNRDGDLDAEVFLHEMTHGLSNRLHSNGSGLTTYTARGMGEGWSDYYARCLLAKPTEDVNAIYQTGGYVTYLLGGLTDNYYYGIRRFPYAVLSNVGANGKPYNPLTFADIDASKYQITDGAYINSPIFAYGGSNEVHNIGEVWCMMLLEMRARLINRLGFAVGNQRALQIVTDAMKVDGANPTFIVSRNSLVSAANSANPGAVGAADANDIRIAFASRGCGAAASMTGSGGTSGVTIAVTEGYLPDLSLGAVTFTDTLGNANGGADPGEDIVLTIPLSNPLAATNSAVTVRVGNYTATYGGIAASGTATQTIPYRVPATAQAGDLLPVSITVTSDAGTVTTTVPLRIGLPTAVSLQNFDGVVAPALPNGWTSTTSGATTAVAWVTSTANAVDTGNSAFGKDVAGTGSGATALGGDTCLVSPAVILPGGSTQLSFKHRYAFEGTTPPNSYDGGVVEIKIGSGAFTDIIAAGGSFVTGPYTNCILNQGSTVNPTSNRCAYVGSVNTATTTTLINLPPAAAGQTVQFRWRVGFDNSTAGTGWYVDSIAYNTFTVASVDTDGDGLQNGYETANGLNPNDPNDATLDSDGDGMTNLQEYLAGTDPRNPASKLGITSTAYSATAGATVNFTGVNGKTYLVEYKDDLLAAAWTTLQSGIVGNGGNVPVTDAGAVGKPARFYRVRVTGQ